MKLKTISLTVIFLLALLSTACAGGAPVNGWAGMTADPEREVAYVAYNTFVHAINLSNGTEKWRYPQKAENSKIFFAAPALTPDQQLIVVSYDKILYSLDPDAGTEKGTFTESTNRYIASPLVTDEMILAPSTDTNLYALDFSLNVLWKFKTEHGQWGTPIANSDKFFLPSMDRHLYAVKSANVEAIWESEDLGGAIPNAPVLGEDGVLYAGTLAPSVVAVQESTGKILWQTPTLGWVWSSPVLHEGVLYAGDVSGTIYAIKAADGSILWKYQPVTAGKNPISGSPLVNEDTLYFITEGSTLYAVDLANGNPRWNKTFTGKLYGSPQLAGDLLLITQLGAKELVLALDLDGNQKWAFVPDK